MSTASEIVDGLGGRDNIVTLEPCITRLRVQVSDAGKVNEAILTAAGAFGVVMTGPIIQVVLGPNAEDIAADIAALD
jgi:PTS system N-acetylglucosamine-specific IIB component